MNYKAIISRSLYIACFLFVCVAAPAVNQAARDDYYSILKPSDITSWNGDDLVLKIWLGAEKLTDVFRIRKATPKEMKSRYRTLARYWHPDKTQEIAAENPKAAKLIGDVMDMLNRANAKLDPLVAKQEQDEYKAALEKEARAEKERAELIEKEAEKSRQEEARRVHDENMVKEQQRRKAEEVAQRNAEQEELRAQRAASQAEYQAIMDRARLKQEAEEKAAKIAELPQPPSDVAGEVHNDEEHQGKHAQQEGEEQQKGEGQQEEENEEGKEEDPEIAKALAESLRVAKLKEDAELHAAELQRIKREHETAESERRERMQAEKEYRERRNLERIQQQQDFLRRQRIAERQEILEKKEMYNSDPVEDLQYERSSYRIQPTQRVADVIRSKISSFDAKTALKILLENPVDINSRRKLLDVNWWEDAGAKPEWQVFMTQYFELIKASPAFVSPQTRLKQAIVSCKVVAADKLVTYFRLHRPIWYVWRDALFLCPEVVPRLLKLEDKWEPGMTWRAFFDMTYMLEVFVETFNGDGDSPHTFKVIEQMLELGAKPSKVDSAMVFAAKLKDRKMFDLMASYGGDPQFDDFYLAKNPRLVNNSDLRQELLTARRDILAVREEERMHTIVEERERNRQDFAAAEMRLRQALAAAEYKRKQVVEAQEEAEAEKEKELRRIDLLKKRAKFKASVNSKLVGVANRFKSIVPGADEVPDSKGWL